MYNRLNCKIQDFARCLQQYSNQDQILFLQQLQKSLILVGYFKGNFKIASKRHLSLDTVLALAHVCVLILMIKQKENTCVFCIRYNKQASLKYSFLFQIKLHQEGCPGSGHRRDQWDLMSKCSFVQQFSLYLPCPNVFRPDGNQRREVLSPQKATTTYVWTEQSESVAIILLKMHCTRFSKVTNLVFFKPLKSVCACVCEQLV